MTNKILSVIMPIYGRPHLLRLGLSSWCKQTVPFDYEIIMLNDKIEDPILDETKKIYNEYKDRLKLRYIFTGQRNSKEKFHWRVPGYAINIGVKQSKGKIIIINDPEMFLLDDCITKMVEPILKNKKILTHTTGRWDGKNQFLPYLQKNKGILTKNNPFNIIPKLKETYPFFLGIDKSEFISIGGYDEDFTGYAFDDADIVFRLLANGCKHLKIKEKAVHLYHPLTKFKIQGNAERARRWRYNKKLWEERRGIVIRNKGRNWGVLDVVS